MFTAAVTRCATPVSRLAELVASLHSESWWATSTWALRPPP